MLRAILGTKINQSQVFDTDGMRIPVTNISTGSCVVVDYKGKDKNGYDAVVLGLGTKRINIVSKAQLGQYKKAGLDKNPPRFLKEVKISDPQKLSENFKVGELIKLDQVFKEKDTVEITGVSKGKGFAGVVKRYHFKGGPRTHGQSDRERAPGSIGQTTTPGRVYKGKRMAGRMGSDRVTLKNLRVVKLDLEKNILTIKGLVPGGRNSLLIIRKINKD